MELVKVENNDIKPSKEFIEEYKNFMKISLAMDLKLKEFKEELKEAMEKTGKKEILLDGFSATYRKATKRQNIDTKALKNDFPDIVLPYVRETEVASSVVIKCE